MMKSFLLPLFLVLAFGANAQGQLNQYKQLFIDNHIVLSAAQLDIEYAKLEYQKSKKAQYPSLELNAQYALRRGGREFEIPTGTLLNPIYNNLNYFNQQDFPEGGNYPKEHINVENTYINFLRSKEYDANLMATIPLLNFSIRENIQAKALEQELAELEFQQVFNREWGTFKINYYAYFKKKELIKTLETNQKRVAAFEEQLQSQQRNHKVTESRLKKVALDRLKIELGIKEQKALLANDQKFLLEAIGGKDTDELLLDKLDETSFQLRYNKQEILQLWSQHNTRIQLINQRSQILEKNIQLSQEAYKPSLNLQLGGGLQGENFTAEEKPLYLVAALNLNWKLYNPKKKVENKQIEIIAQKNKIEQQQFARNSKHHIEVLYDKIQLKGDQLNYLQKSIEYKQSQQSALASKQANGKASAFDIYNQLLDLEESQLEYTTAKFDYLISLCELEQLLGVELLN